MTKALTLDEMEQQSGVGALWLAVQRETGELIVDGQINPRGEIGRGVLKHRPTVATKATRRRA